MLMPSTGPSLPPGAWALCALRHHRSSMFQHDSSQPAGSANLCGGVTGAAGAKQRTRTATQATHTAARSHVYPQPPRHTHPSSTRTRDSGRDTRARAAKANASFALQTSACAMCTRTRSLEVIHRHLKHHVPHPRPQNQKKCRTSLMPTCTEPGMRVAW